MKRTAQYEHNCFIWGHACLQNGLYNFDPLWGMDTLSTVTTLLKFFNHLSEKVSTLKGQNLLPLGANSFLLEYIHFAEEFSAQKQNESLRSCLYKPCKTATCPVTALTYSK